MKNPELKKKYLEICTDFTRGIIEQAIELENGIGKDICDLGYNEAEKLVGKIKGDVDSIIEILADYTDFAIENSYSLYAVNIYKLL